MGKIKKYWKKNFFFLTWVPEKDTWHIICIISSCPQQQEFWLGVCSLLKSGRWILLAHLTLGFGAGLGQAGNQLSLPCPWQAHGCYWSCPTSAQSTISLIHTRIDNCVRTQSVSQVGIFISMCISRRECLPFLQLEETSAPKRVTSNTFKNL